MGLHNMLSYKNYKPDLSCCLVPGDPPPLPPLWILPTELRFPECQAKPALSFLPLPLRAHGISRVGGAEAAAAAAVVSSVAVAAGGCGELGAPGKLLGTLAGK